MLAPGTLPEYWELVWKSGLVEAGQLRAYGNRLREDSSRPGTPHELAQRLIRDGLLTCLQAEYLLKGRWRGFMLDKYRLLERLGEGGMGTVYLAAHVQMRRLVALKVLPPERLKDKATRERFWREARAVAALDHPNLVRAHDAGQDGNFFFLVMEHVDGSSLHELVTTTGPLPVARALAYLRQAATGLQHAHEHGLIHRDIKPGNLLLDRRGQVKVLDLGLARFSDDDRDNLTRDLEADAVLGSVDCISPEQAMDTHTADARSDIYSLGFTGYFLLTGQHPFGPGPAAQKLVWHQLREPPPLREVRPEVSKEVATVLAKMHAKNPAERYQTAREVVEALVPFVGAPVPPPSAKEMPRLCPAVRGEGIEAQFRPVDTEAAAREVPPLWGGAPARSPVTQPDRPREEPRVRSSPTLRSPRTTAADTRRVRQFAPTRPAPESPVPSWPAVQTAGAKRLRLLAGGLAISAFVVIGFVLWSVPGSRPAPTGTQGVAAARAGGIIRPETDGSIVLSARTASCHGELRYETSGDNIGWWTSASDYLSWEIEGPTAKSYDVVLRWSCEGEGNETHCALQVADAKLPFIVEGTGTWHTYKTTKLGTLRVANGKQQATLRVTSKAAPEHAAMNLRSITLVPSKQ